jgi:sterol carrier protein 2
VQGFNQAPPAAQMFGGAGREYRWKYGTRRETFAKIASQGPQARQPTTPMRCSISSSRWKRSWPPRVFDPLTRFQCCPPTCGAAAAILASDDFAKPSTASATPSTSPPSHDHRLRARSFEPSSMIKMIGYDMAKAAPPPGVREGRPRPQGRPGRRAARLLHRQRAAHLRRPRPVPRGGAEQFIWDGDNTYGGKYVTNPSGGLLSKGHPLGATGLAQCTELVWQLRGQADKRQVEGAKVALQHNLGLGGACVVTMYRKTTD